VCFNPICLLKEYRFFCLVGRTAQVSAYPSEKLSPSKTPPQIGITNKKTSFFSNSQSTGPLQDNLIKIFADSQNGKKNAGFMLPD
jgi:hypothetical protein